MCRETESPNISTHVAMSYFIASVLESRDPKAEIGDHFTTEQISIEQDIYVYFRTNAWAGETMEKILIHCRLPKK